MKTRLHYAKKRRQLKGVLRKLKKYEKLGIADSYANLIAKAKLLYQELAFVVSRQFFKKAFTGLSIIALCSIGTLKAQTFAPPVANPFGIFSGYYWASPAFADIDNDGDIDMLRGSYYDYYWFFTGDFIYYENNAGAIATPNFNSPTVNPFGLGFPTDTSHPIFGDLDGDGDLDILSGDYYGNFYYYENVGTPSVPSFASSVQNPFGLTDVGTFSSPSLIDIDNDGDLDMFTGAYYGNIDFFENIGTNTAPNFSASISNPYGIDLTRGGASSYLYHSSPTLTDLDNDGDFDLLVGLYHFDNISFGEQTFMYLENMGSNTAPSFGAAQLNPFGLSVNQALGKIAPEFVDIDLDGDQDIMIGDQNGGINFYENTSPITNNIPLSADTSITINEDQAYTFADTDFPFTDVDPGDALASIEIIGLQSVGTLQLSGTDVTVGQVIPVADIANLVFTPNTDENGASYDSFTFSVSDGTDVSTDHTMTINVDAVNDAPTSLDATVTTDEDAAYTFSDTDFSFTDVDAGDALTSIVITSLESVGTLQLSGANVTVGQVIPVADIVNLVFTPNTGEFGAAYDSFGFTVSDGTAVSAEQTMTINVDEATGIRDIEAVNALTIAPNPVSDILKVSFENYKNKVATIEIFDIVGKSIFVQQSNTTGYNTVDIDASNFAQGVYVVNVTIANQNSSIKFLKK